jgi:ABC-type sugar transport system substrate-binding protein
MQSGRGRRLPVVALICAVGLAVGACGDDEDSGGGDSGQAAAKESRKVGQVFYSTDAYQVALEKWMKQYSKDEGIDFTVCQQALKPEPGVDCVRDWTTQKYDGIIYHAADPASAVAPTREAQQAGIPVVGLAIKPAPGVKLPFLDIDEKEQTIEAGKAAATKAKELFPGKPVSALVLDLPSLPICNELRMGGFIEGLKSVEPDANVISVDGKGDRLGARTVTADAIQSGKDFNVVTACTGEMIQGALSALESAGRGKAVGKKPTTEYVFAIDGDRKEAQQLLDPSSPVMQVMGLTPKENARKGLDLLTRLMDKELPIESEETVPLTSKLLDSDCATVNEYLQDEYLSEPLPCE